MSASVDLPAMPPRAPAPARRARTLRDLGGTAVLAVGYAALAYLGLRWGAAHGVPAPLWPAAGLALAALVLGSPRWWPGIGIGYVAAALLNASANPLWVLATIAAGNTVAALAGRYVLVRTRFNPTLESFRDLLLLLAVSAASAMLSASAGSLAIAQSLPLAPARAWTMWTHWALGDLNGMLLAGTLVFAWLHGGRPREARWWLAFAVCIATTAAIAGYIFLAQRGHRLAFVTIGLLIWPAAALRLRGATAACALVVTIAVTGATLGVGPFIAPGARFVDLQLYILVATAVSLVLAVIADERRAQHALMASEARLRLALEASDTGLWKIDLRTGQMSFSPECARITGIDPCSVEHTRDGVAALVHPDDRQRVRDAFRDALDAHALFESEFRVVRPDGAIIRLEARGRGEFDAAGRPATMRGTITDVTARRGDERRLAEQARLLDLTSDAILIRDLDGRIHYWNDSSVRLYGFTPEEAIGECAGDLLRTRFGQPLSDIRDALMRSDRWDGEVIHHRKDGEPRIIHARWVLTRDAAGDPQAVMQTHTDITERRRAELAAGFLAELDRTIAQAASAEDVAAHGLRLLGTHLGLLRCTLSDIDVEQGQVRTLHEWTDGAPRVSGTYDAREFFTSELGIALASGEAVAIEDLRTDPLTAPFALNYLPYGTVAIAAASYVIEGRLAGTLTLAAGEPRRWRGDELQLLREVVARLWPAIDRAKALAALRESEARFRQMADTAPMMIFVTEPDGRCSYFSRRWTEFTGRMTDAELGFGWRDVIHPDDRDACFGEIETAARQGDAFAVEHRALRWDGAWRWLHATARPRFGSGSEFLGYIGAVMDVTDRREAEEALRQADRRKDEFLATLAHELRNPLSPIRTGLQVLNATDDADTARRTRQMMERQLGHMVRLIDDLLDVSRITSGKVVLQRDRISLQDAARAALESARPLIEAARHRVHVELPDAPLWIDADPTRIAQVIGNLLTNAAKYTPDGGEIVLRATEDDGVARLDVTDTGLGIPPEALSAVFGMFAQVNRTLDRAQGGLGIGLALARRLVEMHGGGIVALSEGLGRGSTFTVRLPLSVELDATAAPLAPAPRPAQRRRVLVVDDNRDAAESLAMMFELDGHATCVAFSAEDALRLAGGFRPDIAFLDIGLPGMNGYELARHLRTGDDAPPRLVAVSGWGGEGDRRRATEAGFDLHLTKPVDPAAVLGALARLGGEPVDADA